MVANKIADILSVLYQVKEINDKISSHLAKKDALLVNVNKYEEELKKLEEEYADKEEEKKKKHKKQKDLEAQVAKYETDILNLEGSRTSIKTNDEYFKLIEKIDHLKNQKDETELQILTIMEEFEEYQRIFKELETKKNSSVKKINEELSKIKNEIETCDSELGGLYKDKEDNIAELSDKVKQTYLKLEQRYPNDPITFLHDNTCTGCNMSVPPQVQVNIKMAEKLENCQNCGRYLLVKKE